jgi:hypothetical protein
MPKREQKTFCLLTLTPQGESKSSLSGILLQNFLDLSGLPQFMLAT